MLILTLIMSMVPVEAYTVNSDAQKMIQCRKTAYLNKPVYYVAIGDSITAGYGLGGNSLKHLATDTDFLNKVVHDSMETCYTRIVANRIAAVIRYNDRIFATAIMAKRLIHRYMRSVEIVGMTGMGYQNLYRPVSYRTADGSFVQNREIEDGGT